MAKSESDYSSRVRTRVREAISGRAASAVAREIGWSQSYMSHRLNGRRPFSIDDLVAIAGVLGIEPTTLTADREQVKV